MSATIDELTIDYTEDGMQTVKELDKAVLTKGAWTTIMYRYQDLDKRSGEYGVDKHSIRRYQKTNGEYRLKSKFNISNKEQAEKVIAILQGWIQ